MTVKSGDLRAWTTQESSELYNIEAWGDGYFHVNPLGNVEVTPHGLDGPKVDLKQLVDDLLRRGLQMPILLRFSDILADRVKRVSLAFQKAIKKYQYDGQYKGVFPIKVNQERLVVQELVEFGAPYDLGLEAGSKPELLIALACQNNDEALIVCNGYKDEEYIDLALIAAKLGKRVIIVVDRYKEVDLIIERSQKLNISPIIGVRTNLNIRSAGRWAESAGDRSKFGLTAYELVRLVKRLESKGMLDCLQMLHFHIGSQISAVRAIKNALHESCRIFVELYRLGAPLRYIDVGGGLAVDYDGSQTNFHSSSNYTLDEYAEDVVSAIGDICQSSNVPHPNIISESGRYLTAHHSILIVEVLGTRKMPTSLPPAKEGEDHQVIADMFEASKNVTQKTFQECYHDIIELREQAQTLFRVGVFDLAMRARAEHIFWHCCHRIGRVISNLAYVPDELNKLRTALSDIYYCNFSVFQSIPDHWACKQLFPTMPIHRLNKRPNRTGTLADLTCDSDGKVDQFIDLHDVKRVLELHDVKKGQPYLLGMFLVGAYQEILGDLHNLFGDTHCVHVMLNKDEGGYVINDIEEGETVQEVLNAVSYTRRELVQSVRRLAENAVKEGLSVEESGQLVRRYEKSLNNYTYLG